MQDRNTSAPIPMTVGIDLADRSWEDCVLSPTGEVVERNRCSVDPLNVTRRFERLKGMGVERLVLEVGAQSAWIARLAVEHDFDVVVANARKLQLISQNVRKTDRNDAELLARLCRVDPELLSPIQHRTEQTQHDLALLRARAALVKARTSLVNSVRGLLKPLGLRVSGCSTETFHKRAEAVVPEYLLPLLGTIGELTQRIREFDRKIEAVSKEQYPVTQLLRQIPGVGPLSALHFVLTIESPDRFNKARNVGAYLGLVPRKSQTGGVDGRDPQLRITKAGDSQMRSLLVTCAHYILGRFGPDSDLRRMGLRIASRGGKNAKKRAVVAVARKLSVVMLRMWQTGEAYEPLRNNPAEPETANLTTATA